MSAPAARSDLLNHLTVILIMLLSGQDSGGRESKADQQMIRRRRKHQISRDCFQAHGKWLSAVRLP